MSRLVGVACVCVIFFTGIYGCSRTDTGSPPQRNTLKLYKRTLLIGLIPEQNVFNQVDRYEPLAKYLSGKTDVNIKLKVLPRYGNIISNFVSSRLDGAFFGSFTYALARAKLGLVLLARPEDLNGVSTYHGLIFVRKDSNIRSAKDMKGKRFAFVDKATTAGYLLPLEYFREHGIDKYQSYLKETYFTGTHEDAIYDVLNRKADVGAAKNTVYERLSARDSRIGNELIILAVSPEVPENGLAVRRDLDESVRNALKDALLSMEKDPEGRKILKGFGARRFVDTTDKDYAPVLRYAHHVGLDLANYDYVND